MGSRRGRKPKQPDRAAIAIAVFLLLVARSSSGTPRALQIAPTYGLGPKMMAYVIAAGMAVLAIGNLVLAWRGDFPERESFDPKAIVLILGGFAGADRHHRVRRRLHSGDRGPVRRDRDGVRAQARDHSISSSARCSAFAVYLLFDKLLTLSLPAGPIERLF